ncbi:MAG TPA: type II toxin-antitoxin system VapC family toxin [Blastocatellia bacterium]|nr:type II toxin-antitoxin system VapC family toxin [Blastocatellia bacterium]
MSGILFDTSVYISALRQGEEVILTLRRAARAGEKGTRPLWLSAVVLEELYAGAIDPKSRRAFEKMERDFSKADRLLIPGQSDWTLAGQVLAKIGLKYGFEQIGRARLTNDALIAMSCARHGFTVLTRNVSDYARIAEFRPFTWELIP